MRLNNIKLDRHETSIPVFEVYIADLNNEPSWVLEKTCIDANEVFATVKELENLKHQCKVVEVVKKYVYFSP